MTDKGILKLTVKHGSNKISYDMTPNATLGDLLNAIEQSTGIPVNYQRLIHNGRTLNVPNGDLDKTLGRGGFGLNSQSKILVLGKKPEESDPDYQKLLQLEKKSSAISPRLFAAEKDIEDMENGFAPKELMTQGLPKLEKQLLLASEELMRVLEDLDAISLNETQKDARAKRKNLVDSIHRLHGESDALVERVRKLKGSH